MAANPGTAPGARPRRQPQWPSAWPVWQMPAALLAAVLTVETVAIVVLAAGVAGHGGLDVRDLQAFLIVCVVGVAHTEIARHVERMRRRLTGDELHVDLGSVWFLAAAVLLPAGYAALATVVVHTHLWWRAGHQRRPLHRQVFNAASMSLSAAAAAAVMRRLTAGERLGFPFDGGSLLVLVAGVAVFLVLNSALVAGAIALSVPGATTARVLGGWNDNLLEIGTLCFGACVAISMIAHPSLVLLALPPLYVLHRAVLAGHLEQAVSTDAKTGLLTAGAWSTRAAHLLRDRRRARRTEPARGILMIDLDHFKKVNDTHGHLAGDRVLVAVADALRAEVREGDLVGRFGGEEFVVLLSGLDHPDDLHTVAERIRHRITTVRVLVDTADGPLTISGLTTSIGAVRHRPPIGLPRLLESADSALYDAKRDGRNTVRHRVVAAPAD